MKELEKRIKDIEDRNKRVENDKAWETCMLRKILIIIFTYVFAVLYLKIADTTNPFLGAVVPCVHFIYLPSQLILLKNIGLKNIDNCKYYVYFYLFHLFIFKILFFYVIIYIG